MLKLLKIFTSLLILLVLNYLFNNQINPYITQIACLIGINIIMALSLNLISGQTGQFSLGHAGFMAIGAYTSAAVTVLAHPFLSKVLSPSSLLPLPSSFPETLIFLIALLAGGLMAALGGILVGFPTLRLRGDYLAIATLGFGEIVRVIILNLDILGGARGFGDIPQEADFFWIYLFVLITLFVISNLISSPKGKALLAIREDEIAAESVGINIAKYKIISFTLGAFFAGIGGGLFAHLMTYLHPNSFTFLKSVEYVVMIVLGGMGSLTGTVIAATLLTILPEALRAASEWRMIIYSLLLIVMMIWRPQGILGNWEWKWIRKN
jgi:branched-chain amino acid transport system permease protein